MLGWSRNLANGLPNPWYLFILEISGIYGIIQKPSSQPYVLRSLSSGIPIAKLQAPLQSPCIHAHSLCQLYSDLGLLLLFLGIVVGLHFLYYEVPSPFNVIQRATTGIYCNIIQPSKMGRYIQCWSGWNKLEAGKVPKNWRPKPSFLGRWRGGTWQTTFRELDKGAVVSKVMSKSPIFLNYWM